MDITYGVLLKQFEGWYEHRMPRLYAYICYQLAEKSAAEDLTALICERAMINLHRYDAERSKMETWIYGIARHEVQRYRRDHRRAPVIVSLESVASEDGLPDISASGRSVEESIHRVEITRYVIQYLGELSEREQEIVALRYGADMAHDEIAHLMGLSAGNVRVLLHRALDKLQQSLLAQFEAADHD